MPLGVRVTIGDVILGDAVGKYKEGESNPQSITYSMDYGIVKHECVGKPKTQCTQPEGLWELDLTFTTVENETKNRLLLLNAGPYMVSTDLIYKSMYIRRKRAVQDPGDPNVFKWDISLIEEND